VAGYLQIQRGFNRDALTLTLPRVAVMTAAKNAHGSASENEHVHSRMHCRGHFCIFRIATSFVSNNVSDTPHPLWVFHFAMADKKVVDVIKLISLVKANVILWDVTRDEYKLSEQKPLA